MEIFNVLKPGVQSSDELKKEIIEQVRKVMGPIAIFRGIEFVKLLPKTRSGKIMRRVMRKMCLGEELGDLSTVEVEASIDEVKEAVADMKARD